MAVEEEAKVEAEVIVEAKEDVKMVEVMNGTEHMTVSIYGRFVQATEMVPVTMVAVKGAAVSLE